MDTGVLYNNTTPQRIYFISPSGLSIVVLHPNKLPKSKKEFPPPILPPLQQ